MKYYGARNTKINDNIINAFKEVLDDGMNALIMTDEELCILVNEKLSDEDKFAYSTFKNWKSKNKDNLEDKTSRYNVDKYKEILALIKKALIIQKDNLFKRLGCDKDWTKWAWIIERKFDAWNIRYKAEIKNTDEKDVKDILNKLKEEANDKTKATTTDGKTDKVS
jgi:hypothetical protein